LVSWAFQLARSSGFRHFQQEDAHRRIL
jgi:hypothetical protein